MNVIQAMIVLVFVLAGIVNGIGAHIDPGITWGLKMVVSHGNEFKRESW